MLGVEAWLGPVECVANSAAMETEQVIDSVGERKEGEAIERSPSGRKLAELRAGEHLCFFYETEQEHRSVLGPFVRHGLEQGQKVLYIADARTGETVLGYLREEGIEVEPFLASGQLAVPGVDDSYGRGGVFDADAMVALLRAETERALAEGYSALRVTGEMSWVLRGLPGSERLIEYEARLNEFFPGSMCLALCQYDRRAFEPALLLDVLATHPLVIAGRDIYENLYYIPPKELLGPDRAAATLRHSLENLARCRQMVDSLRDSEEFTRALFEYNPIETTVVDRQGRVVMFNRAKKISGDRLPRIGDVIYKDYAAGHEIDMYGQLMECIRSGQSKEFPEQRYGNRFLSIKISPFSRGAVITRQDITEHRQAVDELRRSEARFRMLVENAFDGINICEFDPVTSKRRLLFCNDRYVQISGYTREELEAAEDLNQLVIRHGSPTEPVEDYNCIVNEVPFTGTSSWKRPDGKENTYEWTAVPFKVGDKYHIIGIDRDVTERVRMEQELEAAKKRAEQYLEVAGVMLAVLSADETIAVINRKGWEVLGYSRDELLGRNWFDLLVPERVRAQVRAVFKRLMAGDVEPGEYYENPLLRKDGQERLFAFHNTAVRDAEGRVVAVLFSAEDVTERRQAEKALRKSQRLYRALVEQQVEAVCRWLPDTTLTFVNEGYCRFFGKKREELLGLKWVSLVPKSSRASVLKTVRSLVAKPRVYTYQRQAIAADGRICWQEWVDCPILDSEGRLVEFQSVGRDITERMRLEREVLEITERERRQVGHDLHDSVGQELTGVAFMCKVLEENLNARGLAEAADAARIAEHVNEVIALTRRLSSGLSPVELEARGLMAALEKLAADTESVFGISCEFECDETVLIHDNAVATHLYCIAQEAVSNAVRHGRAGYVAVRLAASDGSITLTVEDDGVGVPEDWDERKGMGLRIMKYRAAMIDGTLDVRRGADGGTVVTVQFQRPDSGK